MGSQEELRAARALVSLTPMGPQEPVARAGRRGRFTDVGVFLHSGEVCDKHCYGYEDDQRCCQARAQVSLTPMGSREPGSCDGRRRRVNIRIC